MLVPAIWWASVFTVVESTALNLGSFPPRLSIHSVMTTEASALKAFLLTVPLGMACLAQQYLPHRRGPRAMPHATQSPSVSNPLSSRIGTL